MNMKKVLVVDDDAMLRFCLAEMLKRLGYQAVEADGYNQAVRVIQNNPDITFVITDFKMGEDHPDGLAVIGLIRALARIPIILSSSKLFDGELGGKAMDAGACALLPKPYSFQELRIAVELADEAARQNIDWADRSVTT